MSVYTKLEAARRTDRKRVLMVGTLISCDGSKRVRIRDLSSKGAQVVLESGELAKCDVLLKRDEVGLTFYREISPEDLASS
jgi:hypothetical protein